jgi:hypothetical protein
MTARHDRVARLSHGGPMTSPDQLPSLPARYCAGKIHADRGRPAELDPMAKAGPTRIGLIEDGATFCMSCAHELTRGGVVA